MGIKQGSKVYSNTFPEHSCFIVDRVYKHKSATMIVAHSIVDPSYKVEAHINNFIIYES